VLLALLLAVRSLTESEAEGGRIDYPGIATVTTTVIAVTYALTNGGTQGWTAPATVLALTVAAASVVAFVLLERRATRPIVPAALFGTREFTGVLVAAFRYYFAAFGALPSVSRWLQRGSGLAPLATSLVLTGAGAGVVSPAFPSVAIGSVPPAYGGTAGAAANSARQLGLTLGIAICGTLFAERRDSPATMVTGLLAAYLFSGGLAVVGGTAAWWLLRPRPGRVQATGSSGAISAAAAGP
jgi:hypothetical protein